MSELSNPLRVGNGRPHLFDSPRPPKKCVNCQELESKYVNVIIIELHHPDTFSEIDSLYAVLFDDDTKEIHTRIGELATVRGHIYILEHPTTNCRSINYMLIL